MTNPGIPALRMKSIHVPVAAGLLALIALAAGLEIWAIRDRTMAEARKRAEIAAGTAAVYVSQVFGAVSLALQSIDADPSSPRIVVSGSRAELQAILRRAQAVSPAMLGIALIRTDGQLALNPASLDPQQADLSERPYFIAHRDSDDPALRIDYPVMSRPQNVVSIPVSRRVDQPDGSFGGVVAARVDPAYFAAFFERLDADAVSLVDGGGHLYARFPPVDLLAVGARPLPGLEDGGAFTIQIPGDHLLGHAVPVADTGLSIRAVSSENAAIQTWLRRSATPALGAVLASGVTLLLSAVLRRRARRLSALLDAKTAGERAARLEATHFRDVARNKSDFLAHMGHEIRTPLNAIIGFSEIIATDAMKLGAAARYRDYAGDIRFSAEHLLDVINRILDMSKIEAGKWRLEVGRVDAATLLSTVRHLAEQRAAKEGVTIEIAESGAGIKFAGDERVLVQLLLNLTINAIKFAGEDQRVVLGCACRPDGAIEFRVTDRGRGMSPEDAARALRPFETAHDEEARQRSDTGLGLPLARMFAELHDGTLAIDTAPGKGTTVHVVLPAGA